VERRKQFSGSRSVLLGILKDSNGGVEKERMNKELWPCEMRVLLRWKQCYDDGALVMMMMMRHTLRKNSRDTKNEVNEGSAFGIL
jgi:hypothetical protein